MPVERLSPAGCRCGRPCARHRRCADLDRQLAAAVAARVGPRACGAVRARLDQLHQLRGNRRPACRRLRRSVADAAGRPAPPALSGDDCPTIAGTRGCQKSNPRPGSSASGSVSARAALARDRSVARARRRRRRARACRSCRRRSGRRGSPASAASSVGVGLPPTATIWSSYLQPGARRDRIRGHLADDRLQRRHADDEQHPVQQHGEQEIERRPGEQHRDALPHRLAIERLRRASSRRDGAFALVEQLHVAAERDRGDDVLDRSLPPTRCHSGLPKPIEKRSTRMPRRRATQKCPNSCTATSTPIATRNAAIAIRISVGLSVESCTHSRCGQRSPPAPRGAPSRRLPAHPASELAGRALMPRQHPLDHCRNVQESQPPLEKCGDRDFIGGIEHRRSRAAGLGRGPRQRAAQGNARGPAPRNRAAPPRTRSSDSTPEAMRSGQPSACAIGVRMSGLPSWASIDPSTYSTIECTMLCGCTTTSTCARRQAEQQTGLDQLETLVHQRRRIDRNLAAHEPARMCAGLVGRHAAQSASRGVRRNGPPEAVSRMRRTPRGSAGRVAGRHWKIALCSLSIGISVAPPSRTACMNSGPDITSDSLFASRTRLPARAAASVERKPGSADDRRHDGVDLARARRSRSSACSPASTSVGDAGRCAARRRAARGRSVVDDDREARPMRKALLAQPRDVAVRAASATTSKRSRMAREHVERADADAAGASRVPRRAAARSSQQSQRVRRPSRNTGAAAVTLSTRSSTPPWPGSRLPLSFRPAWRLNRLSVRSPTTEASDDDDAQREKRRGAARRTSTRRPTRHERGAPAARRARLPRSCPGLTRGASLWRPKRAAARSTRRRRPRPPAAAGTAAAADRAVDAAARSASQAGTSTRSPATQPRRAIHARRREQRARAARPATRAAPRAAARSSCVALAPSHHSSRDAAQRNRPRRRRAALDAE